MTTLSALVFDERRDRDAAETPDHATVLIVDDSSSLVRLMAAWVNRAGYQPLKATSVEEAFGLLASHQVDLVVTDLNLPGLGGLDLLAQLAADADDPPPVLVVTGTEDKTVLGAASALGARAIFAKPFALDELTEAINDILHPPPPSHSARQAA